MPVAMTSGKNQKEAVPATEKRRFESNITFAEVCALKDARGLIVGTADNDRPGSIMIFRLDNFNRVFEIQAHSLKVTRIRLNFENNFMFSGSKDGSLGIWEVKDQMKKHDKEGF
jgi:hypothetical protein